MDTPVLIAVTGARWEADLVAAFERGPGVRVVRRCVDLADLLAAAAAGVARVALVHPGLRRLDRAAVARLEADGLAVVGLTDPGDEAGERRLRQLGLAEVVPADGGRERIAAAVAAALAGRRPQDAPDPPDAPGLEDGPGRLVAVWGPTGAPGRTTVAVTLADELAAAGGPALLADADTYGGAVAQLLGLLEEAPGLAAAARAANAGVLDVPALAGLARRVGGSGLLVLTGIARADRWPELRPSSLEVVWPYARRLAAATVVDCGFCLEEDEDLTFDTSAPQRNGATLTTLEHADVVLAVGAADPVGLHRLVRGLAELREILPDADVRVVLTKVRRGGAGPDPGRAAADVLRRFAGVEPALLVPADPAACDRAVLTGRTLREVAPDSPARRALAAFAGALGRELTGAAPVVAGGARRRLFGRR